MNKTEQRRFDEGFDEGVYGVAPDTLYAKGEEAVRYSLAKGEYGGPEDDSYRIVLAWLDLRALRRDRMNLMLSIIATIISIGAIIPQIPAIYDFIKRLL
jgi:hypothetical protein